MDKSLVANLIKNIDKNNLISEGSSRKVYCIDNYVIKKAKNNRGEIECSNEYWIYNNIEDTYKKFLCPILHYEYDYVIMKKAEIISIDVFKSSIEQKVSDVIKYLWETYQMDDFDLGCNFNWGILNNHPVIVDYGHNYYDELLQD